MAVGIVGGVVARRIVYPLMILALLFVGVNIVAQRVASTRAAEAAQRIFGLPSLPTVNIDAFPILIRALQGRIPGATFEAVDVPVDEGDLALAHVRLEMDGLVLPDLGSILRGFDGATVIVQRATAIAEVDEASLNAFLKRHDADVTVSITPERAVARATMRAGGRDRRVNAVGSIRVREGEVSFVPRRVTVDGEEPSSEAMRELAERAATFSVELPALPGGIRVDEVELGEQLIRFVAEVRNYRLSAAERPNDPQ